MLLQRVFLSCARTDWQLADQALKELRAVAASLDTTVSETIYSLMEYAEGVILQGTGDLKSALDIFQKPVFSLQKYVNRTAKNDPRRDTAILAALNSVLIMRDPFRSSRPASSQILASVEPFCRSSPNKYIQAAYFLVCATTQTESTIQTKHDLHHSLQAATAISNSQITCLALTYMSWKYFHNVVSGQSEKSALAARAMARKADDKLWISVTEDLLATTLDQQGKAAEAQAMRDTANASLSALSPALKKTTTSRSGSDYGGNPQGVRMKAVEI